MFWREIGESEKAGNCRSSDGTYWVVAEYVTEDFNTTCAVHIEDCEGWWLSGCHSSVEYCLHKPYVLGSIPSSHWSFHFPLFHLKASNLYSNVQQEF